LGPIRPWGVLKFTEMKAIFRIDKDGNFDSFVYTGPGKVPLFIPPKKWNEAKDGAPPEAPMVIPPDPGEPKDEIPSKLKKKIEDEKKKIN